MNNIQWAFVLLFLWDPELRESKVTGNWLQNKMPSVRREASRGFHAVLPGNLTPQMHSQFPPGEALCPEGDAYLCKAWAPRSPPRPVP